MNESHREVEPIVNFRSKAGLTFIKMNETYTSGTLECTVLKAYSTVSKQFAADTFGEEYSQLLLDKINKFQGYYMKMAIYITKDIVSFLSRCI